MKQEPLISIVLLCYNYAHLLGRALEGIERQTFRDFEVVFVNDGSTDNSLEVFKKFVEKHPEISCKIVSFSENRGLANADNAGANAATGKYLMFHDADDWMDDNTLELLASVALKSDPDRVVAMYRSVDDNNRVVHTQKMGNDPIQWRYTMQQANLFRNSIYKEHAIQLKDSLWVDAEKTLRFSRYAKKVEYIEKPCYNYLVHLDSTSKNKQIHQRMWTERYAWETLVKSVCDEYKGANEEEMKYLEYGLIFLYYSYMLQHLRNAPLKDKYNDAIKLQKVMKKYFPDYLSNKIVLTRLKVKGKETFRSKNIVKMMMFFEKHNLIKFAMWAYHIASKVFYFQAC